MTFTLELENFQGPFDVLLELLNKQQLEITELSLAKVTDGFLDYLSELELDLDEMNWFLFVATKLTLDKSQKILLVETTEADIDITESLRQYSAVKHLADLLAKSSKSPQYSRVEGYRKQATQLCNQEDFMALYQATLTQYKKLPKSKIINSRSKHILQVRRQFINHLRKLKSFSEMEVLNAKTRNEAALYLLTLLDMLRTGEIRLFSESEKTLEFA